MYLKKIEAQGFKSFANKTILEFLPGIMGIVGPNGSGKSNVADAVRWVLGEQSAKQLRGASMQDVIFAGTESRKPLGYAYVSLTLDNADHALPMDFDEVVITRRVYRSGESEYLINGNACRLRDINELFYDTGVGKEGYSIISQGQIDKILSTKPEDRRELFDEAAGIVKFKKRKDIALKKLEDEQNNLLRVTDVLNELEKQVGPLHRQAETARTYLKLRDELKVYEVGMFYRESEELRKKLETVVEKLTIAKDDYDQASRASEQMRRDYESVTGKRDALDKQIEEDFAELSGLGIEKENAEGRIKVLEEQAQSLKAAEEELKKRLAVLDAKRASLAGEKDVYNTEKGELNEKLDASDEAINAFVKEIEDQEDNIRILSHQLELKQSGLLDDLKSQADISADSQGIAVKLEQAEESRQAIVTAIAEIDTQQQANKTENINLEKELADIRKDIAEKQRVLEKAQLETAQAEKRLHDCDEELAAKVSEYRVAQSQLEALKNMAERYDGYGAAIQQVMNFKKGNKAVRGVVADIISVEKKYEVAIETALGGHIQNVVTKDEATAKEMVEFLKKGKLGRVTFLPMDAVKGAETPDKDVLREEGIIDTAGNLVSFDPEYQGIIDRLLGRTYVADNISHALAVAKKYRYKHHIVTLEGEYLAPGGSITGGAFRNNSNLLSRNREIDAFNKKISQLSAAGEELRAQRGDMAAYLEKTKSALSQAMDDLSEYKVTEAAKAASFDAAISERDRLDGLMTEKRIEQENLLMLITELTGKVKDSKLAEQEAKETENRRRKENEDLLSQIESEREKLKDMNLRHTEMKLEYSKLEERDSFVTDNINRIIDEMEDIDDEKRALLLQSDPEGLAALAKNREKEKLEKRRDQLATQITELNEKISLASAARDGFVAEQKKLLEGKDESFDRAATLDKDIIRLGNQQERIQEQIDAQAAYLWNEYEMTPMEAEAQKYEGKESISEMRKLISEHKSAIKELGPVNVNAIEEEKEVGERYTFMSAQHEDLLKARDSILEVIEELETGMRAQFEEKFAKIKSEFDKVFKDLFGGGTGTLELLPEEDGDVLKSGISIIAQPPGKKLQNMMQLSGGEKALTAIALIFAIQNLKPSPFCLLDEIEAALDETNVARFAGYLERLKTTTQLITITHRRGTMEAADKLYGITMQERGISTVVAVNFTDAAKYGEEA